MSNLQEIRAKLEDRGETELAEALDTNLMRIPPLDIAEDILKETNATLGKVKRKRGLSGIVPIQNIEATALRRKPDLVARLQEAAQKIGDADPKLAAQIEEMAKDAEKKMLEAELRKMQQQPAQ